MSLKDTGLVCNLKKNENSIESNILNNSKSFPNSVDIKPINHGKIGFIGLGRITGATLSQLVNDEYRSLIGLDEINLFYRKEEKERAGVFIDGLNQKSFNLSINQTGDLYELGQNSEIVVVAIGGEENQGREKLMGKYFKDIIEIMEGLGDSKSKILMVTNYVTSNCLTAHLSSQQENPNIIGFTRLDYTRGKSILKEWLDEEEHRSDLEIELDVLGPHGYDMLITNIRIGQDIKNAKPIFDNKRLGFYFEDSSKTIENLSYKTAEKGEQIYKILREKRNSTDTAIQIVKSIDKMVKGGRDTAAIGIDLGEICDCGLPMPKYPTFTSLPIRYKNGIPIIPTSFNPKEIPKEYREKLRKNLLNEEKGYINYLKEQKGKFPILEKHFNL